MRLTLAISPCPNDTFMFDALINGRIDTRGLDFEVSFADIEQLNNRVLDCTNSAPDISKISYAVLPEIIDRYSLLDSGSALGYGNGPLLVARKDAIRRWRGGLRQDAAQQQRTMRQGGADGDSSGFSVAVPGVHTTANLLLQRLFSEFTDRRPLLFSEIAPAVARGDFDAGILIHEGRFTFRDHGLELIADLGAEWESATAPLAEALAGAISAPATPLPYSSIPYMGPTSPRPVDTVLPLPLGAIVASRRLPQEVVETVEELLRESIEYAFANPEKSREFVKSHAREMDDDVIDSHISLFVNDNSLSLSPAARLAIRTLTGEKMLHGEL